MHPQSTGRRLAGIGLWLVQILLAAFFAFVGYMKTTAPMADLERYHAWVSRLPEWIARGVGLSEVLCAVALLLPRLPRGSRSPAAMSALVLALNQVIAIAFHAQRRELADALPQNLLLIGLLALVWWGRARAPAPRPTS